MSGLPPGRLYAGVKKGLRLARGAAWTAWIRTSGGSVGVGLQVERGVHLRWGPHAGLQLGDHVYLGYGVVLDVPRGGRLRVGSRCKIMHYTVIAAAHAVTLGEHTQIAEHCSVRDSDHGTAVGVPMREQDVSSAVVIGDDVWVAAGVRVLRGTTIGKGCVIGANAVARGTFAPCTISVGVPARVVRHRTAGTDRTTR